MTLFLRVHLGSRPFPLYLPGYEGCQQTVGHFVEFKHENKNPSNSAMGMSFKTSACKSMFGA